MPFFTCVLVSPFLAFLHVTERKPIKLDGPV